MSNVPGKLEAAMTNAISAMKESTQLDPTAILCVQLAASLDNYTHPQVAQEFRRAYAALIELDKATPDEANPLGDAEKRTADKRAGHAPVNGTNVYAFPGSTG